MNIFSKHQLIKKAVTRLNNKMTFLMTFIIDNYCHVISIEFSEKELSYIARVINIKNMQANKIKALSER